MAGKHEQKRKPTRKPVQRDRVRRSSREASTAKAESAGAYQDPDIARDVPHHPNTRHMRHVVTSWRMFGVIAFAVIMLLGGIVGLAFFARPTTSAVEMRNLTPFPEFTAERFMNGSYFSDLSLWYADTYPLREPMVAADHAVDSLFGISTGTGMVGGNVQADEIPTGESSSASTEPKEAPASPPNEKMVAAEIQDSIMSGVYVDNGAAYSIYYFSQYAADTYVAAMNTAAERLDGVSSVYSILSPANCITLDDDLANSLGGSDQQQTLDYLRTRFDTRVKAVEIVDDIKAHRDEYLYFRTDHHWTQMGAYYAYKAFCEVKGIQPADITSWKELNLGEFQGTYYDTIASMGDVNVDTIDARVPSGTNDMTYWTADGEEAEGAVVDAAAADWEPSFKYSCYIQGDQPRAVIHNPNVTDGSSCLVVKDSYGCAFVPNLVDSYENVHVLDFRETDSNICDYAIENEIQDVIFMTGMKIGLTDSAAETLLAEVS